MADAAKRKSRGHAPATGGGVSKKRAAANPGVKDGKGATATAAAPGDSDATTVFRVYGSAESEIVEFDSEDYVDCYNSDERECAEECARDELEIWRDLTHAKDAVFESRAAANKAARETFLEAMEDMGAQYRATQV